MANVYKRGKTWTVRITKREKKMVKQKDGSYKLESVLVQPSKGGFKTKAEATKYGIEWEAKQIAGANLSINPTFAAYFKEYYETYKQPKVKSSTLKRYETHEKYIKDYFQETKIKDITKSDYQKFINWFSKDHAIGTVKKLHTQIKDCISFAVDDGVVYKDFTNHASLSGNNKKVKPIEWLNLNEMEKLSKHISYVRQPRYTSAYLILTALYTGARLGELSALTWSDVDFKNKTISISKSWNQDRRELSTPKTKSSIRTIAVNDFVLDLIKELKVNDSEKIFATKRTGFPPTSQAINQALRRYLIDIGIDRPSFHFHSLRHTHASYLLASGIDVQTVSRRLGHANATITLKVYAHMIDEFKHQEQEQVLQTLSKIAE
ncbi:tyrosine-type recombinase/integrase [Lactobacillus kalixensis]|uniref:Integrase n=1 Tax=Lactobacillus kalixensis DSM 16043 TaxID=1423763 RepID=A0A0R1U1F0_9LACO|nr:site-specific integrase [Lactobacillus kalixensis]KRL87233.1 integrase [Lactobacillus kalixensis DSM 16043]